MQINSKGLNKAHIIGPSLLMVVGIFVSFFLYHANREAQIDSINKLVQEHLRTVALLISERLEARFIALDRMAKRHRGDSEQMLKDWKRDVINYYNDYLGFQRLEWANKSTEIKWVHPIKGNEAVVGFVLNSEGQRDFVIEKALENRQGAISKLIHLERGGIGFLSIHPTFADYGLSGYIVGVYRAADIFSKTIDNEYNLEIRFGDEVAYVQGADKSDNYTIDANVELRNIKIGLRTSATKEMIASELNALKAAIYPFVVLLIFLIISTLSFFLMRSRYLLREALNHAKEARAAIDESIIYAKTNTKGIILEVNDKFVIISGYSRKELIGQDHRILNSGQHSKQFFMDLWSTIAKGNVWRGEIQNRSKNGKLYWVDTSIIPLRNSKGKIVGFSALRTEITDKKEVELKLNQSQTKALRALETKTRFLANMSHEIRTPMNGIIGLTEVLKGRIVENGQLEIIQSIQKSGITLLKIIDDILDFSKLEAGKVELEIVSIDIQKEIIQIVELLSEKASQNGSIISTKFDQKIAGWIYADPVRVRQVVTNLLSNAIKFTQNGSIEVRVEMDVFDSDPFVKISVKDSGIGIPREQQEKLFQSFSQVDASTTRKYGGTGLGLSICKGLVGTMGGRLWLNSTANIGSIFYFTFPYKESNEAPVWDLDREEGNSVIDPSISILVAEDNPINRRVVEGYLGNIGCQADYAKNGREAVSMSKSKKYDLILMDCNMPELDGFQATQEIKASGNSPRIIALTASAMVEDKEKCLQVGMDGFLSKPISKAQLIRVLNAGLIQVSF
ncbi:MAG: ATP-binding protein [Oligoflexales bacterium]